ncbi:MAG: enoyl-CoA hydratase/isomerase family protein [Bacillota bacterium]
MSYGTIIVEKKEGIATITLNRPPFNPLNSQVYRDLAAAAAELEADKEIRAVIIAGSGEKAFAAGADINEMKNMTPVEMYEFIKVAASAYNSIERIGKPTIAALNGLTLGGGCELALACDIRIASDSAKIGLPEVNLGIIPGGGGTQRLPRLIGEARAKEMMFLGEAIDAVQAEKIGLVNRVAPAGQIMEEALKLAEKLSQKAPVAIRMLKESVSTGLNADLASGLEHECKCCVVAFSSDDRREGFSAFAEKRKPNFLGR